MGKFYDSVPVSAIVRIRDMMYTVKDPFRLDQGDVSFDAPDTFKQAVAKAMAENRTHYLPTVGIPPLRKAFAEKMRKKNGIPIGSDDEVLVTNGGTHGLYRRLPRAARARRRSDHPGSRVAADDGDGQGRGRRAGPGPAARRARLALEHRRRREGDHAEDPRALSQLAEQSVGRRADARRTSSSWRRSRAIATCGWSRTKPTRTSSTRASTSASRRCRACTTAPFRSTR